MTKVFEIAVISVMFGAYLILPISWFFHAMRRQKMVSAGNSKFKIHAKSVLVAAWLLFGFVGAAVVVLLCFVFEKDLLPLLFFAEIWVLVPLSVWYLNRRSVRLSPVEEEPVAVPSKFK